MKIANFLEKGEIRPELLDGEALDVAKEFERAGITTHQVRKFYDEVKRLKGRLQQENASYRRIKPLVVMLKSKAQYAANSKKKGMPVFSDFMSKCIDNLKAETEDEERKKFDAFCLFFEAVYGFANLKNN
jgi:CRISPR type III-A-associated protein Csm2